MVTAESAESAEKTKRFLLYVLRELIIPEEDCG
jgi:hypothetical protein